MDPEYEEKMVNILLGRIVNTVVDFYREVKDLKKYMCMYDEYRIIDFRIGFFVEEMNLHILR